MRYSYIHQKEYSETSWDVAHLYEHLFTYAFQSYLQSIGLHPGVSGSISGDTFEHIIFINAIYYDKRVADAYNYFLSTPTLVNTSFTSQALLEIETEEKITLTTKNKARLDAQLHSLILKPWMENTSLPSNTILDTKITSTPEEVFEVNRTAKKYRDVIVGIYADINRLDDSEQVLFLRLSIIIGDIINYAIRSKLHSLYHFGSSPISKDREIMGNMHHFRFSRKVSLKLIKETAEDALHTIDIQSAIPLITAQFDEFANSAVWNSVVVDYYYHTGILTNTKHISSLATPQRVMSILSKIEIHVRAMHHNDSEWFV